MTGSMGAGASDQAKRKPRSGTEEGAPGKSGELTEAQAQAVAHREGPCLCLAGPGSGKTTVITRRIVHLIQEAHVHPLEILVITFTKAAATEMKERFAGLMGGKTCPVTFGTFHAVFFQMLKSAYHYTAANIL